MGERITVQAKDGGSFGAYLARPRSGESAPGLLVIQEIFGINRTMRSLADGFAELGYLALVPDLFWRQEPGVELVDEGTDMARAFALYNGFDETLGVEDLKSALAALRHLEGCNGRVGTVGYCLGGSLAYLMATRSDADCNVSYYGIGIDQKLDELPQISRPLMMHIAMEDEFVPAEPRERIIEAVAAHNRISAYTYAGVGHAFARVGGHTYREAAAEQANSRTRVFLSLQLGDPPL